ncbi:MAG TPA: DUF2382 domain-containing protein [Allosphingosinicella sp.]|nr:DUF2382 domain-containing protein [Allosphingosinicella sp.]
MANTLDPRQPSGDARQELEPDARGRVEEEVLPLVEENLAIHRRTVETGIVRVRTVLQEHEEVAKADIFRHQVSVEHVPINREIDHIPTPWEDGDVLVVPVVEEVLVVEKRLILREELRITRKREVDHVEQPVSLRSMQALVERHEVSGDKSGKKEGTR